MKTILAACVALGLFASASRGAIVITEVDPSGSGATYGADWFELTNTGPSAVDITGWKMDDNSNAFANAVPIRGVTSITSGTSVVFAEGNATGSTDATIMTNFIAAWFGSSAPAGFTMGFYGGTSVGLSSTTDAVNVFDSAGNTVARVDFNAATANVSFDNSAGANNVVISSLSVAGQHGAFTAPSGEVGSPGTIAGAVPEPASLALLGLGAAALVARRKR